jgi:hypothetical protein
MENLYHLIYVSKEVHHFEKDEIFELLSQSSKANKKKNVTGILLHDETSFFQILEGEKDVIENLFNFISKDKRHYNIIQQFGKNFS